MIAPDVKLNYDEETLDITSTNELENYDINEIDEDIKLFQQDALVHKAIEQGVDLREYSKQIQQDLKKIEIESIDDYLQEAERLADLHSQLRDCDNVLEKMEQMLQSFQDSLGDTTLAIKKLQDKSFSMHIQLNNRKGAAQTLHDFVTKAVVSQRLVTEINEWKVDERYLSPIVELDAHLKNLNKLNKKYPSYDEIEPQITRITNIAVSKVRAFLESKVKEFGSKNRSNPQVELQTTLLKFKYFYDFLEDHSPQNSANIRKSYATVLGNYYFNSFKNYTAALQKRFPKAFAKEAFNYNTIVEVTSFSLTSLQTYTNLTNLSNLWGSAEKLSKSEEFFDLGDRYEQIRRNSLINLDAQQSDNVEFPELWNSTFVLFTNTITAEYSFMLDFYSSNANELFGVVFGTTFSLLNQFTESFCSQTWDSIGVLLLLRRIADMQEMMNKRSVNDQSLKQFWVDLEKMLWERFMIIFKKNYESVQQLADNDFKQLNANKSLVTREKTSCLISKKFAGLYVSIYRLGYGQDKALVDDMHKLSKLFISVLEQMSKLSKPPKFAKIDHSLSINCADQILKLMLTYDISSAITALFANLLQVSVDELVNDLLNYNQIGAHKLKSFLEQTEKLVSRDKSRDTNMKILSSTEITIATSKKPAIQYLNLIVEEFNKKWSEQLLLLHTNIKNLFPHREETTSEVMKRASAEWLKLFFRLEAVLDMIYGVNKSKLNVTEQMIRYELRSKYNAN